MFNITRVRTSKKSKQIIYQQSQKDIISTYDEDYGKIFVNKKINVTLETVYILHHFIYLMNNNKLIN